jgi:serine/threonine-protein kinase
MPLQGRYEIRDVIGKGGMGVVYRAWDSVIRREVALKTIRDSPSREALELFRKECAVLAQVSHPNIIEIFDLGELEAESGPKPYFVMPLLNGQTLDWIIRRQPARLTVGRALDIVCQTCRGLQAAHEKGLIHRDLKPSNVFVLNDDSVKIIDFGVAHMADTRSTIGHKGTLLYMSPEQLEMKPLTPLSDLFSVAALCYETLTGRRPFERAGQGEIVRAILAENPVPVSELNPAVSPAVSRVIHKALAKQPRHRFPSARDFADALQKALRNEPLEFLDPSRLKPRLERATRAFEQGDLVFASEIVGELEAEGFLSTEVAALRSDLDRTIRGQRVELLLKSARTRFEEQEEALALEKLAEIAQLDPGNTAALQLRAAIERRQADRKVETLFTQAEQHLAARAYGQARETLERILEMRPGHEGARRLLAEADAQEQDYSRARLEKDALHQDALACYRAGELSAASEKLVRLLELERRFPDPDAEAAARRQRLFDQVSAEHAALEAACAEAGRRYAAGDFGGVLAICNEYLARYPAHAELQRLRRAVVEQVRHSLPGVVAEIDRQVEAEPDLGRKIELLQGAVRHYPGESYLLETLKLLEDRRALVQSLVARAQLLEELDQFQDAAEQLEGLHAVYPDYPGLAREIARLRERRREQLRHRALERFWKKAEAAEWAEAATLADRFAADFAGDPELERLRQAVRQGLDRERQASELAREGRDLCLAGLTEPGLARLREAFRRNPASADVRVALLEHLIEHSREMLTSDWRTAEALAREAVALHPASVAARNALELALDRAAEDRIRRVIAEARTWQSQGNPAAAARCVEAGLLEHPTDPRLLHLREALAAADAAAAPAAAHPPSPASLWRRPAFLAVLAAAAVLVLLVLLLALARGQLYRS